jgi:hypothetical protein
MAETKGYSCQQGIYIKKYHSPPALSPEDREIQYNKNPQSPSNPITMSAKLCFLTVGATASFSALIEAAVSPAFLTALESQGYTELSVQYGQDGKPLFEKCKSIAQGSSKLKVTGFDLDKTGLGRHMRRAKGRKDAVEGVVISHAGME